MSKAYEVSKEQWAELKQAVRRACGGSEFPVQNVCRWLIRDHPAAPAAPGSRWPAVCPHCEAVFPEAFGWRGYWGGFCLACGSDVEPVLPGLAPLVPGAPVFGPIAARPPGSEEG